MSSGDDKEASAGPIDAARVAGAGQATRTSLQHASGALGEASMLADRLMPTDLERAAVLLGARPERCMLCNGERQRELFQSDGKVFWICESCELVYVHDIYPEFVTRAAGSPSVEALESTPPRRGKKFQRWLKALLPHRKLNRLLDVGCGQGEFLQHAREQGWQALGIDVDPLRVELARSGRGLEVFAGELHEAAYASNSFDVVFMSEVIEHIVEPVPLMQEIRRVLRPGGVAFVRTGNARSWSARLRGAAWDYYRFCFHGHIRYFGPRSARALAEASGFERVEVETQGFAIMESGELNHRWYKLPVKLAQSVLSPIVGPLGAGHRIIMIFHRGE